MSEKERLTKDIAEITAMMTGSLPNIERALLHEDRKDLRKRLAEVSDGE